MRAVSIAQSQGVTQMTVVPETVTLSLEEYLARDTEADMRSESWGGTVYPTPGGYHLHGLIISNLWRILWQGLAYESIEIHGSELRLKVTNRGFAYPDVTVLVGEPELSWEGGIANLLNPTLIIEVLSKSTGDFGLNEKFDYYKTILSFSEYLVISQVEPHIRQFTRQADGTWHVQAYEGLAASIHLTPLPCTMALAEVYRRVEFE